ncbi:MAG: zinc ribbon domain-containing protein [Candidatus Heimdallarchaeota archaeon]
MRRRGFRPGRLVRNIVRRSTRRQRRFFRRRSRRFIIGGAILLALAGTHNSYKLRDRDVERLENHYGRPAEDLTEDEITSGMRKLNIQKIELDDDDRARVYKSDEKEEGFKSSGQKYCSHCGDMTVQGASFCTNCGAAI